MNSEPNQSGLTFLEVVMALAISGLLLAAIGGVIGNALNAEQSTRLQNDTLQQARFAMRRMTNAVSKAQRLLLPLGENPATAWSESVHKILTVTLDPTQDRDKDGWADANNDKDFLDVNKNGSRDPGEPERIDEDTGNDATNDGQAGITGIDDDNDGNVDEGASTDNDEDLISFEDTMDGSDNDGDGSIDEDFGKDMNGDGQSGIAGVDDDFDGLIDEGNSNTADDDEDGVGGEDWFDYQVFFLNGTTLMERLPNINPVSGSDYTEYAIAENVSQLRVERIIGGNGTTILVDLTLTLSPPGGVPVTLNTRTGVGSGL